MIADRVYCEDASVAVPPGWRWASLESLVTHDGIFCDGDWVESKDQDPDGEVRLIQLADVGVARFRDRSDRSLTLAKANELRCTVLRTGDILVARMPDPLGRACLFPGSDRPCVTVVDVAIVRPMNPDVDGRWLMHRINARDFREAVSSLQSGSTRLRISRKNLARIHFLVPPLGVQRSIVAELEKQFSRLDEAVANLQRVKANLKRYERSTIQSLTDPKSFETAVSGCLADVAHSLDNMRKPVNKLERAKRPGTIPYLGANGPTGTIDVPLFDEELVLVVEDETFVGRTTPFSYYFSGPCWVNNHTHVLRAKPDKVLPKYLNLALSYYPFIPLTTGSTGRRKLTKAALMAAPITVPTLEVQRYVISEADRRLSVMRQVHVEVEANLQRAAALRQSVLSTAFSGGFSEH